MKIVSQIHLSLFEQWTIFLENARLSPAAVFTKRTYVLSMYISRIH